MGLGAVAEGGMREDRGEDARFVIITPHDSFSTPTESRDEVGTGTRIY